MNPFDASIMMFVNQFVGRSWLVDHVIFFLSGENLLKGGVILALFWYLWFLPGEQREENRHGLVLLLGACLAALAIGRLLQLYLPFRHRPLHTPELGLTISPELPPHLFEGWSSFPSDHAALFFAFSTGIFLLAPSLGLLATAHTVLIICLPRLYLGLHYPTDLLSGAFIGASAASLFCGQRNRKGISLTLMSWERRAPAPCYAALFLITFEFARLFEDVRNIGAFLLKTATILLGNA